MKRVEANRNFLNKIWNASRFVMMNLEGEQEINPKELQKEDKWIISRANTLAKEISQNIENYDLGVAAAKLYDFFWDEYCDWYIEMVKPRLYNKDDLTRPAALWALREVLINALKLLHPFVPFITEEIFLALRNYTAKEGKEETIMLSSIPTYSEHLNYPEDEQKMQLLQTAIKAIRNVRAQMNVNPGRKVKIIVVSENADTRQVFADSRFFASLGMANEVIIQENHAGIDDDAISIVVPAAKIYMPFADLVDIDQEIARLEREHEKLSKDLERVLVRLNNPGFVAKAPQKVIDEEREKEGKFREMLESVSEQIRRLQKI